MDNKLDKGGKMLITLFLSWFILILGLAALSPPSKENGEPNQCKCQCIKESSGVNK